MTDLRNVIAHILEYKQHLEEANEATTQQYVVLPILRALGWDDTNLTSMEVLPEYKVGNGNVDYALKIGQKPELFVECKKWDEPLKKHESQIANYAFNAGAPIGVLTNGKIWCFYFSWVEGKPVPERIFCEIDIGNLENAVSNLETYLLRSNMTSERAKQNAQKALKEKEKMSISEISPIIPNSNPVDDVTDSPSEKRPITVLPKLDGEWTVERIRNSLSPELRTYYKKTYREERTKLFYRGIAGVLNLVQKKEWRLNPPQCSKMLCGFKLTDKGVIGRIRRIFGILPSGRFPDSETKDRDGELIKKSGTSNPPRIFVRITEEEAKQLESKDDECEFCGVDYDKSVDWVYYNIPENMLELLPVLEFAYKKHTGN